MVIHKCKHCQYSSGLKSNTVRHMKNRHNDTSKKTVVLNQAVEESIQVYHKCKHCNFTSNYRPNVIRHQKKKHNDVSKVTVTEKILAKLLPKGSVSKAAPVCEIQRPDKVQQETRRHPVIQPAVSFESHVKAEIDIDDGYDPLE